MDKKRVVLLILDGWGYRLEEEHNGTVLSTPENYIKLLYNNEHTLLDASGEDVGLPKGQMGNSEVGHMNIGAGRVIYQDLLRISNDVNDGEIKNNKAINLFLDNAIKNSGRVHLMGLMSDGGVHSHIDHFKAVIKIAKERGVKELYIHCFTDGRDTPPTAGISYITDMQNFLSEIKYGKIATIIGRFYAMDRDKRWDRVEKAWDALRNGKGINAHDPISAIANNTETDEFILPTIIEGVDGKIKDGDSVFMMNFRSDRARQLADVMVDENFKEFNRGDKPLLDILTLTEYDKTLKLPVAYEPEFYENNLAKVISDNGLKQLRITETEKYPHVTYFFNSGEEQPYPNEIRELIPSPRDVATYDLKPEMSVNETTNKFEEHFRKGDIDLVVMNFANPDMVGHTGVQDAIIKACQAVDVAIGRVVKIVDDMDAVLMLTADHGNAECMWDYENNQPHTAHTTNKVPFIIHNYKCRLGMNGGKLADIAPTILEVLGLPQPKEMTGKSLIDK